MTLQQNTDRIQTTHIGSLPRPHALLDVMKAKYRRPALRPETIRRLLAEAVKDAVRKQAECGIDIVTDGEFSKPGFFTYIQERLEGFERRPDQKMKLFQKEVEAFPEYYAEYFKQAMMGGAIVGLAPVVCVGAGEISRRTVRAGRHRQRQEGRGGGRRARSSRVPAGDGGVGRRHQRILQVRRGLFPRAGRRAQQGIPRHRRCRHSGADRRSVPARHFLRARSRPRADETPRRNLCRGDKHRA